MVWGEILFGAFSKDTLRIKSWNELNYDGVETCLLNTQKIEQMFSQQRHGPAAIFCTREQFGEFKLNIWGLVDKSHKKEVFRIRPMQRVFGSVSDCETSTVELSSDTLGQFCAKDRDKRLRKHLVLKVKGIE
jgi:hypothetical protein